LRAFISYGTIQNWLPRRPLPFDTGWATKAKWLPAHVLVLHAEIYPSVRDSLPDEIKDRGQVRAMWQWARDLDRDNLLWREFCRPIEVETGSKEDLAIPPRRHLRFMLSRGGGGGGPNRERLPEV
jgi:hypothetical protein